MNYFYHTKRKIASLSWKKRKNFPDSALFCLSKTAGVISAPAAAMISNDTPISTSGFFVKNHAAQRKIPCLLCVQWAILRGFNFSLAT